MRAALVVLALSFVAGTAAAQECAGQPPSRASASYWDYIETCGCDKLARVDRASLDHKRFQKACAAWHERHPRPGVIVVAASPQPGALTSPAPMVITLPEARPECAAEPPSRVSDAYWGYVDACGCAKLEAVPEASPDHGRFQKACASWRERNPGPLEIVTPSPQPPR